MLEGNTRTEPVVPSCSITAKPLVYWLVLGGAASRMHGLTWQVAESYLDNIPSRLNPCFSCLIQSGRHKSFST